MPAQIDLAALGVHAPSGYTIRRTGWTDPVAQALVAAQQEELDALYADSGPLGDDLDFIEVVDLVCVESVAPAGGTTEPVAVGALIERLGVAEVKRMYVLPGHRRHGFGALVLTALEVLAAVHGNASLILATGPRQAGAIALYDRTGWVRIPAYGPYADIPVVSCFRRDLTDLLHREASAMPMVKSRRAARSVVLDADGRVLMTENDLRGEIHWGLPGGGVEDGESTSEAAARELTEETGLVGVALDGPVAEREYYDDFPDVTLHQREQLFWGRSATTQVSTAGIDAAEDYLVGLRWWSVDELEASTARRHPSRLPELVRMLLTSGTPAVPIPLTDAADSIALNVLR